MKNKKIKAILGKLVKINKYVKINMLINKLQYLDLKELELLSNSVESEILFRTGDAQVDDCMITYKEKAQC